MEIQVERSGCGCGGCLSAVFGVGMSVLLPLFILGMLSVGRAGSDAAAVEALNACPAVTDVLGSPIRESALSMGCGQSSSGGGSGRAQWSMRVTGPKGSASASYSASYAGNSPWTVTSAIVETDAGTISAVPCPTGSPVPSKPPGERPKSRPKRR